MALVSCIILILHTNNKYATKAKQIYYSPMLQIIVIPADYTKYPYTRISQAGVVMVVVWLPD